MSRSVPAIQRERGRYGSGPGGAFRPQRARAPASGSLGPSEAPKPRIPRGLYRTFTHRVPAAPAVPRAGGQRRRALCGARSETLQIRKSSFVHHHGAAKFRVRKKRHCKPLRRVCLALRCSLRARRRGVAKPWRAGKMVSRRRHTGRARMWWP